MNNNAAHFKEVVKRYRSLMLKSRDAVGLIAVELFNESFDVEGQIQRGGRVNKWEKRGFGPPSRASKRLLQDRGSLRRGNKYRKAGTRLVEIFNEKPHALLQNEGGTIKVTAKMRSFFWAMVYRHWQKGVSYDVATRQLASNKKSQKFGAEAEFWFRMAMAKQIEVKARPFIYETPELPFRVDKYFTKKIANIFKQ